MTRHTLHGTLFLLALGLGCHLTKPERVPRDSPTGTGGTPRVDARPLDTNRADEREASPDGLPPTLDLGVPDQGATPDAPGRDIPLHEDAPLDASQAIDASVSVAPDAHALLPDTSAEDGLPMDGRPIPDDASVATGGHVATGGVLATGGRVATGGVLATGGTAGTGGLACPPPYVFCDDFSAGMERWTPTLGTWQITEERTLSQASAGTGVVTITQGDWSDQTVEARLRVLAFGGTSSSYRAEIYARYRDPDDFLALSVRGDGKLGFRQGSRNLGTPVDIGQVGEDWHTLTLKVFNAAGQVWLEAYWDGSLKTTTASASPVGETDGSAGVGVYGLVQAEFDDVRISTP